MNNLAGNVPRSARTGKQIPPSRGAGHVTTKIMAQRKIEPKKATPKTPKASRTVFQHQPAWWTNTRLHAIIIFLFCGLLYANTLEHGFAQDDAIVITENMFTTEGVSGIPGILKYDTFYGFFKEEGKAQLVSGGRYRPLTLIQFAMEVQLFGMKPWVGHLFNVLWYGLTCVVLYWLLLALLREQKNLTYVHFIALATTLLFAAHPVHTEAVANIKGRDEIITLLGSLAALLFLLKAFREKKMLWNALAGLVFFLGLLAKENAITFLAVVPLAYYFFTSAKGKDIAIQLIPFAAAAVIFLIIRSSVIAGGFGEPTLELMNNPFVKVQGGQYVHFTGSEKLATILFTLGKYVQLLIFPHPLTHDYYPRQIDIMQFGDWQVLLSLLLYLGIGIYALLRLPKKDPVSFGILYFLITLSIVSNIVFPIGTNMSERFLFMPSVGFCLVVAVLLWRLANLKNPVQFRQLYPALSIVAVVAVLYSIKTVVRNTVWKDNFTLFTTDIHNSPNSAKLRNAMGGELSTQAIKTENEAQRAAMLQEAEGHLLEAIRIHPTYKNAYLLLGNVNNYQKDYEESIKYYQEALRIDPNYQEARGNLAVTFRDAGRYAGEQQQDLNKAVNYLLKAYEFNPTDPETLRLLGVSYGIGGDNAKAIEYFSKAVELQPNNASLLFTLGTAYYNAGNPERGAELQQRARAIDPNVGQGN